MRINTNKIWQKLVGLFLCLLILVPTVAQAQLLNSSVPISSSQIGGVVGEDGLGSSILGALGIDGYLNAFNSTMSRISKVQCLTAEAQKALEVADKVDSWSFGGMKLLTGDAGEAAMIKGKITSLDSAKSCTEAKLKDIKETKIATLTQGQLRQSLIQQYSTELTTIQKRLDELNAQYRNATRSLWKSILVKSLLTTTKAVSAGLVNSLTNKYKVADFQRYSDVVASQVYTTQLLQSQDAGDQFILRSFLNNPLAQQQIEPAVYQKADAALGFKPDDADIYDANFYSNMARVGASDTNPMLIQAAMIGQAQSMQAQGKQSALAEVEQSNGYKSPRSCAGNLTQQASIDLEYKAMSREVADRAKLLSELQGYQSSAKNLSAEQQTQLNNDLALAQKDFDSASSRLKALPSKYSSPTLEICKGIVSPASLVNTGIDKVFGQFTKNLGDYNDNNLPFFVNFISDIGTQIGSSLIYGGNKDTAILSEMNNIDKAAAYGLNFANARKSEALSRGIDFDYDVNSKVANGYTLIWNVFDVKDASYVTIKGTGISDTTKLPLSGKYDIQTSANSSYLLKVYNRSGQMLTSTILDIEATNNQFQYSGTGPLVRGASVSKPAVPLRGSVGISPRGGN